MNKSIYTAAFLIFALSLSGVSLAARAGVSGVTATPAMGGTSSMGIGTAASSGGAPSIGGGDSVGSGSSGMGVGNGTGGSGYNSTGPGSSGASGYTASGTESSVGQINENVAAGQSSSFGTMDSGSGSAAVQPSSVDTPVDPESNPNSSLSDSGSVSSADSVD